MIIHRITVGRASIHLVIDRPGLGGKALAVALLISPVAGHLYCGLPRCCRCLPENASRSLPAQTRNARSTGAYEKTNRPCREKPHGRTFVSFFHRRQYILRSDWK